jgi:hypothetical protein
MQCRHNVEDLSEVLSNEASVSMQERMAGMTDHKKRRLSIAEDVPILISAMEEEQRVDFTLAVR